MITRLHAQTRKRQLGQGMSEYIIITALIALAAIAVVGSFGNVIQQQFAAMANALAGGEPAAIAAPGVAAGTPALDSWNGAGGGGGGGGAAAKVP
nr:hypothetical protein [uncultured Halomonas sp.]